MKLTNNNELTNTGAGIVCVGFTTTHDDSCAGVGVSTVMRTPKQILERLALVAPSVAIETHWTHDQDSQWSDLAECMQGESPDDWQAWNSEVTAKAIIAGTEVEGNAYLGGTWEKASDHPSKSNPDISGYLPQMIEEALTELRRDAKSLGVEIEAAILFIKQEMRERYDESQARREVVTR